jgi:parvulin-like peptidyl-prolyl isomerase
MRIITGLVVVSMHAAALFSSPQQAGAPQTLPLKNGRPAVALVNRDPVYLDELLREKGPGADRDGLQQGRATADDLVLLDRLITIKLLVQEAGTMGLAETPEIQKQVEVTSREILREVLIDRLVKDVAPDPVIVDKLYKEAVREWKTSSLLFTDEPSAARAQKELASGAPFADVASKAAAAKTAKADTDSTYHSLKDYLPQIGSAISGLGVGQVSGVIRVPAGIVVVKVVDVRYPENADAKAEAKKTALSQQQVAFMKAHDQTLRRQYVTVNTALMKSLNYEAAQPTLDVLLKDKRVVADIKGAPPVTVGDLTDYLRMQTFHGSDQAAQKKRMNARKDEALDATLGRRLLNLEAARLGIDKTNTYRDRVTGYRESLVFDSFVQKVIAPENKVKEDEVKQYYTAHPKDYSYPGMLRVRSLAFSRRNAADDALRKLREGTDFNWLAANADGRIPKGTAGVLTLDAGQPITVDSMPEGMQKALVGVKTAESRVYASPEGPVYLLSVQQVIGSTSRPYADVREEAAQKLYAEKIKKGIETYSAKLRAKTTVEAYLARAR